MLRFLRLSAPQADFCSNFPKTRFVVVTDANVTVTPANITAINPHIVAGPAVYTAG